MSPLLTDLVIIFMTLFAAASLVDAIIHRSWRRFGVEFGILAVLFFVLVITMGFPVAQSKMAFGGGVTPIGALLVMFPCTLLGIVAHYLFFLRGKFNPLTFLKPFVISPIVFLPLIGSLQNVTEIVPVQLISFAILAFQNGFFWRAALEK
jgi:fatty acid desaturase